MLSKINLISYPNVLAVYTKSRVELFGKPGYAKNAY
jgi:hypothetical protein